MDQLITYGKLTKNYCALQSDGSVVYDCVGDELLAASGTRLPVTADFKSNLTTRYVFDWKDFEPFIQGSMVHEGKRTNDLRIIEGEILGTLPSYTVFDLSAGIKRNNWTLNMYVKNLFDESAQFSKFAMCPETVCGASGVDAQYPNGQIYTIANQPRTIGLRFSQEF